MRWARDSDWILVYIFSRYVWEWGVMERNSHLFTLPFLLDYPILPCSRDTNNTANKLGPSHMLSAQHSSYEQCRLKP